VRFSASFAFAVDVAMLTLGGYLKKKENLSARLGDVLSAMYLASMVLKHHENQGRPAEDLPIVEWACRNQLYKAQEQLHDFLRNFPNRFLGWAMRALIFPGGRAYSAPSDRLGRKLADAVLAPGEVRDRLSRFVYRTLEPGNPLGLLQEALVLSQTAEPIEKRIRVEGVKTGKVTALDVPGQIAQALTQGIISDTEAAMLRDYDRKVMELISVDDFESHELGAQAQPAPEAQSNVSGFHLHPGQVA
jgi:acyl-CoA dehydrogenase